MSSDETEFFRQCQGLRHDISNEIGLPLQHDPTGPDTYVEISVVAKNLGSILTSSGTISLTPNSIHYVRREDVETLIRQGLVTEISPN
ncbi:GINS complex, subunit Psf1 [Kipferlia bialata]|uniref:GINS complex, subunit Psf1 n=1 Tax=Kipferlia bialata TaxID=797122 RepID=A0A9K3DAJ5_9EUKA|nr:GINS complex, subunit Psf1 [Kipferlia bialata]|eukprot:g13073.t1